MNWMPVMGSSNVNAISYDEGLRECYVRFMDGSVYCYDDVSPEEWQALVHAPSKGKYVNIVLRRAKAYRKELSAPVENIDVKTVDSNPKV